MISTDELAERVAIWLRLQDGITEVEVVDTDNPPFDAPPEAFVGQAFIGFMNDGIPMSMSIGVTE